MSSDYIRYTAVNMTGAMYYISIISIIIIITFIITTAGGVSSIILFFFFSNMCRKYTYFLRCLYYYARHFCSRRGQLKNAKFT